MIGITGKTGLIGSGIDLGTKICSRFKDPVDFMAKEMKDKGIIKILSLAGNSNARSYSDLDYTSEVSFNLNLIRALAENNGQMFIYASTAHVYGSQKFGMPISEDALPKPVTQYGNMKLKIEDEVLKCAQRENLQALNLRIFSVFDRKMKDNFLAGHISKLVAAGEKEATIRNSDDIRDFSTPSQVSDLIQKVLQKELTSELGIPSWLNICSGRGISIREKLNQEFKGEISFDFQAGYSEIPYLVGDNSRLLGIV